MNRVDQVEQHAHVLFHRGQIAGQQRDRARRRGQSITHRDCVIGGVRILDAGFGVRASPDPEIPAATEPAQDRHATSRDDRSESE